MTDNSKAMYLSSDVLYAGATLREYAAIHIAASFAAGRLMEDVSPREHAPETVIARAAILVADALLEELAK